MFDDRTTATIKREALNELSPQSGVSPLAGSYADATIGAAAARVSALYAALRTVPGMLFVSETSGGFLDLVGSDYFNLVRRQGTLARADMEFTGTPGTVIPQGTVFLTATGLQFLTDVAVTIGTIGRATVSITAREVGSQYNITSGSLTAMWRNIAGLVSYYNTEAQGGTDTESDKALYERIDEARKRPRTSGNGWDYRGWALSVDGVGEAKIVELKDGPGTVEVMAVDANYAPASPEMLTAIETVVAEKRPIGAAVTVVAPQELPLSVAATVTIDTGVTTLDEVQRRFTEGLEDYRRTLIETKYSRIYYSPQEDTSYTLVYNRVLALLLTIPGVENFSVLTVNGGDTDVVSDSDTIFTLEEVVVT